MAENIDYSAGESAAITEGYRALRSALADKGEAENKRKAREIEQKGLFGSGIKSSDLQDFGNLAVKGAEFGEARMGRKMDRATKSFDRRVAADERRAAILQKRADLGDANALTELKGIHMGMKERRDSFEDFMGKYQEKGLWGRSFGGDDVGYRTEGESKYSQAMEKEKPGSGPGDETDWSNLGDLGEGREGRFEPEGDRLDRYSSYPHQPREFEKMDYETGGDGGMPEQPPGESQEGGPHPFAAQGTRPPDRSGYFPGRDSGDGSYKPEPYSRYTDGMMDLSKKKDDLVGTSGGIAERGTGSNKFDPNPELGLGESRISRIGKNPARLPISGALRDRTSLQRRRDDVLEKRKLIADKEQALGQQKLEENQMIQDITNKYRRRELEDLVSGIDLN